MDEELGFGRVAGGDGANTACNEESDAAGFDVGVEVCDCDLERPDVRVRCGA